MSRIIWKSDFACLASAVLLNAVQIRRSWILLPLLVLVMPLCWVSLSLAQQNDHSILVLEGSRSSAGSNAQVELQTAVPLATSAKPSFKLPASTQQFLPPSPPESMASDFNNAASFRRSTQGTLTAATAKQTGETRSAVELLRATLDNDESTPETSATLMADRGTFTSQLPGDAPSPNDSDLQTDNSFGSSPSSSNLRTNSANSTSRNRFGDFGESKSPKVASRFAPLTSTPSIESKQNPAAPPAKTAANGFAAPAIVPASAQQPIKPADSLNRFGAPAPTASQRFPQPSSPKATPPQPSRLTASQPITPRPTSTPPAITQTQPNSQSLASTSSPQTGGRFPSARTNFANPAQPKSNQPTTLQSSSFGGSRSVSDSSSSGDSNLRAVSDPNSRSLVRSGAGIKSERSSNPVIKRQASSLSSSFPNSSVASQSNTGSSRFAQQPGGFANQTRPQPLRGKAINNDNDLRSNSSNVRTPTQPSTNRDQSSGKADRASIDFAQQQLRNIQPTSADANGTPVRLQDLFSEPLTGNQRKQMVAQYWETYYDLAALKISSDYEAWLNSISTSGAEKGLLTAAQRMASDQELAAKIQLGKSQSRLMDFMPTPRPSEFAPLPADEPLVEQYVTDYEKYKRVRTLPTSLRGIDPMLASTLKLITQRAETVSTAKNAADQAGRSVRNQQIPLASAIAAGQLWRDAQLDMVASTVSYNQAISDFVLTLEPNRSPAQLTAFMLGAPKNGSQSRAANSLNQSTRSAANQQGWPTNRPQFR